MIFKGLRFSTSANFCKIYVNTIRERGNSLEMNKFSEIHLALFLQNSVLPPNSNPEKEKGLKLRLTAKFSLKLCF